jgi:hypothetical protein
VTTCVCICAGCARRVRQRGGEDGPSTRPRRDQPGDREGRAKATAAKARQSRPRREGQPHGPVAGPEARPGWPPARRARRR